VRPTAIRQKFGCWETLFTLVGAKMENGCASHRKRWSTIGTTLTAVITYAPHRRRRITRPIQFIASRLVQELRRGGKSAMPNDAVSRYGSVASLGGASGSEAAELARREYDTGHTPSWITRRR